MAMNKKGSLVMVYGLMIAVVVIILSIAFAPVLKQFTDDARAPSTDTTVGLDCANSSISDFDKGSCQMVDLTLPIIIGAFILMGGIIFIAKIIFE